MGKNCLTKPRSFWNLEQKQKSPGINFEKSGHPILEQYLIVWIESHFSIQNIAMSKTKNWNERNVFKYTNIWSLELVE